MPTERRDRTRFARAAGCAALLAAACLVAPQAAVAAGEDDPCGPPRAGEQCGPGNGQQTSGGGEKVSHAGWPAITGIVWKVLDNANHQKVGGPDNDELLGHHGSDRIAGADGNDILWGDWDPAGNSSRQSDVQRGGPGNDWLYSSHGKNAMYGGPGNDYLYAFYGRGILDCGPGRDTVRYRLNGAYQVRNCETIKHFCAYGSDGHGGCKKPGERRAVTRRRG
jgi:hypothetical protein